MQQPAEVSCGFASLDLKLCRIDRLHEQIQNVRVERLRLFGAAGGAVFAIVALVAFAIAPGPSSANGTTVVEYYSAHATATLWQAALVALSVVLFIWFAETFAGQMSTGPVAVVGAAVTAALYLVAIGCWEVLGEILGRADGADLSDGDAHALYAAGLGAVHLANFTAAAFVGATAAAMLVSAVPWRWLGSIGIGFALVQLISAVIVLASQSHWSDVVGTVVFLAFLAWVFAASVRLVLAIRRGEVAAPAAGL